MNNHNFADHRIAPRRTRLRHMRGALLFVAATAVGCVSEALAEESLTVEAVERMAHVLTERNPKVNNAEIRAYLSFGEPNSTVWLLYRYESPDRFHMLLALPEENVGFLASDAKRTIIYDPEHKRMLVVSDIIPGLRLGFRDGSVAFNWGFGDMSTFPPSESTTGSPEHLVFDLPSLLRSPNIDRREVESLEDGKQRLLLTTLNGGHIFATVDPTAPFEFTELQADSAEGHTWLSVRVNQPLPPAPQLPDTKTIRTMFGVEQTTAPKSLAAMTRLLALSIMPPAAKGTAGSELRKAVESMTSNRPNWRSIEQSLQRDSPKLRRLLPAR